MKTSQKNLKTCHSDIQKVMSEVIKLRDIRITCGARGKLEQDAAFAAGNSKLRFPKSKHNKTPSMAVDVVPYPEMWSSVQAFKDLSVIVKKVASELGVDLKWGGDWDSFKDYPHWEL